MSDGIIDSWKDAPVAYRRLSACAVRPNKAELRCLKFLTRTDLDSMWYYVGDGFLVIDGKNPDFWDGGTRLVEMYGDYWHHGQDPQERIDFFKQLGYDCLVIWEHELRGER